MSLEERSSLSIYDGIIWDGERGLIVELSDDHLNAYVQWESAPRMRGATSLKNKHVSPLGLSQSRALALELGVLEAIA